MALDTTGNDKGGNWSGEFSIFLADIIYSAVA
jgi:hypothetical protein